MQPGDPAPGQGVRGGIAVEQMAKEEVRAELPGQLQREDPHAREPHAGMVVQIPSPGQLPGPGVEHGDAGLARRGGLVAQRQGVVGGRPGEQRPDLFEIVRPHRRVVLQPALPVAAPVHLLNELLGRGRREPLEHRRQHLVLPHQPAAQVGRQPRHVGPVVRAEIEVAQPPVAVAGMGQKGVETFEAGRPGRWPAHGVVPPRSD